MRKISQHKLLTAYALQYAESVRLLSYVIQFPNETDEDNTALQMFKAYQSSCTDEKDRHETIGEFLDSLSCISCMTAYPTKYEFIVHHTAKSDTTKYEKFELSLNKATIIRDLRMIIENDPSRESEVEALIESFKSGQLLIDKANTSKRLEEQVG
jgi:hypothetical protein